ncbi:hypothetical protein NZ698_16170 [Chryseobacterium sp. PBS4-4]|uniref:Uncharacterized protein n=1 Tax=Chryseobacterium edaphi TaxID=2976532 RepID=A0ABT2W939_9FLAO|nr:hypothetical protein [Chryseobacterium edaphi]MCU7618733.1 hypothetical protein [Chryseobacterium edaphi]
MEIKDIIVADFSLNIKVVEVNKKKLTKSLFDQLPEYFPFDPTGKFVADKIFGYFKIKSGKETIDFLLFLKGNKVYKSDLRFLKKLSKINLLSQYHVNQDLTNYIFFRKSKENYIEESHLGDEIYSMTYKTKEVFNEKGQNIIQDCKNNASKFLVEIKDLHLFF